MENQIITILITTILVAFIVAQDFKMKKIKKKLKKSKKYGRDLTDQLVEQTSFINATIGKNIESKYVTLEEMDNANLEELLKRYTESGQYDLCAEIRDILNSRK